MALNWNQFRGEDEDIATKNPPGGRLNWSTFRTPEDVQYASTVAQEAPKTTTVEFGGKQVPVQKVQEVAAKRGVTPETIMRLDTWPGRLETVLGQSVIGQFLTEVGEGMNQLGEGVLAGGSEAFASASSLVGADTLAKGFDKYTQNIYQNRRKRNEFTEFIQRDGDVTALLGDRGNRIFNGVSRTIGQVALPVKGAATLGVNAPVATYSIIINDNWTGGLQESREAGLTGWDAVAYTGIKTGIDAGLTALMGAVGKQVGATTFTTGLDPTARAAVAKSLAKNGTYDAIKQLKSEAIGTGLEGIEEWMIDVGQQINGVYAGTQKKVNWDQALDSFLTGSAAKAGTSIAQKIQAVSRNIEKTEQALPDIVKGVEAAHQDLLDGVVTADKPPGTKRADFEAATNRRRTSAQTRESYNDTLKAAVEQTDGVARTEQSKILGLESTLNANKEHIAGLHSELAAVEQELQPKKDAKGKTIKNADPEFRGRLKARAAELRDEINAKRKESQKLSNKLTASRDAVSEQLSEQSAVPEQPAAPPIDTGPATPTEPVVSQAKQRAIQLSDTRSKISDALLETGRGQVPRWDVRVADAVQAIQDFVPFELQADFLDAAKLVDSPQRFNKLLKSLDTHLERHDHKLAMVEFKDAIAGARDLRAEYANIVKDIKDSYDLHRPSPKTQEAIAALQVAVENDPEIILSDSDMDLLKRAGKTAIRDLAAEDIRGLAGTIQSAAYQSAVADKFLTAEWAGSIKDTSAEIAGEVSQAIPYAGKEGPGGTKIRTKSSGFVREFSTRPEVDWTRLSPKLSNLSWEGIGVQAFADFRGKIKDWVVGHDEVWNKVGLTRAQGAVDWIKTKGGDDAREQWRNATRKIGGLELKRDEARLLYSLGMDPNRRRVLMEHGVVYERGGKLGPFTEEMFNEIQSFIGEEGEAVSQYEYNYNNNELFHSMNEVSRKLTGRNITEKQNVTPSVVSDANHAQLFGADKPRGLHSATVDSYKSLKHRGGTSKPLSVPVGLENATDYMYAHINRVNRFVAYGEKARDINAVLNQENVRDSIREKGGDTAYNHITETLQATTAGHRPGGELEKVVAAGTGTFAGAVIAGNLSTMGMQYANVFVSSAYEDGGMGRSMRSVGKWLANPVSESQRAEAFLSKHSPVYWDRVKAGNYKGHITMGMLPERRLYRPASVTDLVMEKSVQLAEEYGAIPINFLKAESAVQELQGLQPGMDGYEAAVARQWERNLYRGDNTNNPIEDTTLIRSAKNNPALSPAALFMSAPTKTLSLLPKAYDELSQGKYKNAAATTAALATSVAFEETLRLIFSPPKDEKEKSISRNMILGLVGRYPIIGPILEDQGRKWFGWKTYGFQQNLLTGAIEDMAQSSVAMGQGILDTIDGNQEPDKLIEQTLDVLSAFGPAKGVPTPPLVRQYRRVKEGRLIANPVDAITP
jgi:hypothetical protein